MKTLVIEAPRCYSKIFLYLWYLHTFYLWYSVNQVIIIRALINETLKIVIDKVHYKKAFVKFVFDNIFYGACEILIFYGTFNVTSNGTSNVEIIYVQLQS